MKHAFTLIEVLVVVVVLGILMAVVVPAFAGFKYEAADKSRMADMRAIESALELYHNDNWKYPNTGNAWWSDAPAYGGKEYTGSNGYIPDLAPAYMKALPKDPNQAYPADNKGYLYRSTGKDYKLLAHYTPDSFEPSNTLVDHRRPTYSWAIYSNGGRDW